MFNLSNFTYIDDNYPIDRTAIKILFTIIMVSLCLVTTFGNLTVIYIYRDTQFVGNLFIISLACADLIVGCFVMPFASFYAFTNSWKMGLGICQIWLISDYIASTASILSIFILSVDRYWSIVSPFSYIGKQNSSRAMVTIAFTWIISFLWIIPIIGWPYFANNGIRHIPSNKCDTEFNDNIIFKLSTAIFNFFLPLITMIFINTKIYIVVRKSYRSQVSRYSLSTTVTREFSTKRKFSFISRFKSHKSDANIEMKEISRDRPRSLSRCSTININTRRSLPSRESLLKTASDMNHLADVDKKGRLSPVFSHKDSINPEEPISKRAFRKTSVVSSFMTSFDIRKNKLEDTIGRPLNKQEKAFRQLAGIVTCFTCCYLPYFICFLIVALCEDCISEEAYTLTIWLGYLNSAINPFIYALLSTKSKNIFRNRRNTSMLIRKFSKV